VCEPKRRRVKRAACIYDTQSGAGAREPCLPVDGTFCSSQTSEGVVGPSGRCRGRDAERSIQCTVLHDDRTWSIVIGGTP
jgi:hypothetical protein